MSVRLYFSRTAAGYVAAAWSERGLLGLSFPQATREEARALLAAGGVPLSGAAASAGEEELHLLLEENLCAYFAGRAVDFSAVPVDFSPYTPFVARVLEFVRSIGYGELWSYGQVAAALGVPGAARAVGRALGQNRTPLVVPCHRVLTREGGLGGFSGGLDLKRRLLELEGHRPGPGGRYQLTKVFCVG